MLSCSRGGSGTGVERKERSHANEQMRDNLMEVAFKVVGHRCHSVRRQKKMEVEREGVRWEEPCQQRCES